MRRIKQQVAKNAKDSRFCCSSRPLRFLVGFLFLLLAGCATVPFDTEPKADFRQVEPAAMLAAFELGVVQDFEAVESVVFEFFGKELTGLGCISIHPEEEAYALTCMNPAGIKLFEFRGVGTKVETLFMPPQLEKVKGRFAESVAQDIRRIYLGWTPSEDAELKRKKNRLLFTDRIDGIKEEYTYAGPRRVLVRKRFSKGWKTQCLIHYFEYENVGEKFYPCGIVLHNRKYHYRLILRMKQLYPTQNDG